MSELFLVPGKAVEEQSKQTDNDESDADETPTENEKGSTNNTEEFDGQRKTVYLDHKNNPDHNAEAILPLTNKKNVRKSARKGRNFIKDLKAQGLLIIKNKPEKVLKHGWDWDTFNKMIGNEPLTLKSEPMPRDYTH